MIDIGLEVLDYPTNEKLKIRQNQLNNRISKCRDERNKIMTEEIKYCEELEAVTHLRKWRGKQDE